MLRSQKLFAVDHCLETLVGVGHPEHFVEQNCPVELCDSRRVTLAFLTVCRCVVLFEKTLALVLCYVVLDLQLPSWSQQKKSR